MADLPSLATWMSELSSAFANLSKPQIKRLAEYSLGMIIAQGSGLSSVAWVISQLLGQSYTSVQQRLREFYLPASRKWGGKRRELDVSACFGPMLAWLLRGWQGSRLPIALDATNRGDRFTVLSIHVVIRSCAIPVAWKVVPAHEKGSWQPHWLGLLDQFASLVPERMTVIAMTDKGLYAKWLYAKIRELGWHPFMRVNPERIAFKAEHEDYRPLGRLLNQPGDRFAARGTLFRTPSARLDCTLLGLWQHGYDQPVWVVTDLAPEAGDPLWYTLRFWIERGYFHTKSGGWDWQETRMTDPERAERLWLVMAVASVLLVRQGGACDVQRQLPRTTADKRRGQNRRDRDDQNQADESQCDAPPPADPESPSPSGQNQTNASPRPTRRILSVFSAGLLFMNIVLLTGQPLPTATMTPEPWPATVGHHEPVANDLPPP